MSITTPRRISAYRIRHTLHTLGFASGVCLLLWVARACLSGETRFAGFIWNLILAWIPVGIALVIRRRAEAGQFGRGFWGWGVAWLLFFPNAFYIITDFIHYKKFGQGGVPKHLDILMTMAFACGGMFLGCLSLYLLHLLVRARYGWQKGWAFAVGVLALGSFGIYLGRFARLNSWDVLTRPFKLVRELAEVFMLPELRVVLYFVPTMFLFSLAVYLFIVSTARLHEDEPAPSPPPPPEPPR